MRFYTGRMFPEKYRGGVFIAEHVSWNRSTPIGYRVILREDRERACPSYEPFAAGWLKGSSASGRPADVLVMPDGALLVSDDKAGRIYPPHPHRQLASLSSFPVRCPSRDNGRRFDRSSRRVPMDAWTTNTVQAADRVLRFLWKVYGWMASGLGLTAMVAFAVAGLKGLCSGCWSATASVLRPRDRRAGAGLLPVRPGGASRPRHGRRRFALYSALNGVTLSAILLVYTASR